MSKIAMDGLSCSFKNRFLIFVLFVLCFLLLGDKSIHAAVGSNGEITLLGSYYRRNYGNNAHTTVRRYTGSVGVNILPTTLVEIGYSEIRTSFRQEPIQTVDTQEQTLGLSIVQTLVPVELILQPYVKIGGAQYNRKQSGTIQGIATPQTMTKSPSGLLGTGVRVFLMRGFSLKVEASSYLPDFKVSEAKNNVGVEGGLSWRF